MRKQLLLALAIAGISLSSCRPICAAYDISGNGPRKKPTFKKDDGHQKNKYSDAARKAAEQTDAELYISIMYLITNK